MHSAWPYAFIGLGFIVILTIDSLPIYTVRELNESVGSLLARGFAPRFVLNASVSKPQIKKGHLWLTLTDGKASISAVVWASQLQKFDFRPNEGDGVVIVGKLNFWSARATLAVQVWDIRPSISTVLRQFEVVKALFLKEGLLDSARRRALPSYPNRIAILTSVPSSALADMLRTAKERWPLTKLFIIPIPVQGGVAKKIQTALITLAAKQALLEIDVIVLARGGGSREDLMVFDDEDLCREIAKFPVPVVTGLGHEDDLTVADLVADYRAATPTAAIVDILPSLQMAEYQCDQRRGKLNDYFTWFLQRKKQQLIDIRDKWRSQSPSILIQKKRDILIRKNQLLKALSPERWLSRGFSIVRNGAGTPVKSIKDVAVEERLMIQLSDGQIASTVDKIQLKMFEE